MKSDRMVERTVSEWVDGQWVKAGRKLSDYRDTRAFVLLGEPGSGKSTSFKLAADGEGNAMRVRARPFIKRPLNSKWQGRTLFIDGLDEVRVGGGDPRDPLDELASRLERLRKPRFRLSCRENAWLGRNDFGVLSSAVDGDGLHLLRLDPLTPDNALDMLREAGIPEGPQSFLWSAEERGLVAFLRNPLLLNLLVKARTEGSWPDSRIATFEIACELLVRECNSEHYVAPSGTFPIETVVLAAGRLCAILLLCDKAGWSVHGPGHKDFPAVSEAGPKQPLLRFALGTGLFAGSAENGRRPLHRQIAEFLAAKYLDQAIQDHGLSFKRVLRQMHGIDGIVMSDLRGLSLWLASKNADVRRSLIETDPVGIAFHGDAKDISHTEARVLLKRMEKHLQHQSLTRQWESWSSASLRALMSGPTRGLLWEMLRDANRRSARQRVVRILLVGLKETPVSASANARDILANVIRDASWWPAIRLRALRVLICMTGEEEEDSVIVKTLLHDIDQRSMQEEDSGELRGEMLSYLYPRLFPADQLWNYAEYIWGGDEPAAPASLGTQTQAHKFWTKHVVDASAPEDIKILLDGLAARAAELIPLLAQNDVVSVVLRLVARGLELFGDEVGIDKLHEWLELVEADVGRRGLVPAHCRTQVIRFREVDAQEEIYAWLRDHENIQLELILESLMRMEQWAPGRTVINDVGAKFLGAEAPAGFRRWCLDIAVALASTNPRVAEELRFWAVTEGWCEWGPPLSYEDVQSALGDAPLWQDWLKQRAQPTTPRDYDMPELHRSREYVDARERRDAYIASIRGHCGEITAGVGPAIMLHDLGEVYLWGVREDGVNQAHSDLEAHLGDDQHLVKVVTDGFRAVSRRSDLPDLAEIAHLHARGLASHFASPFVAGLFEDEHAGADPLQRLDEDGLSRALAFYLLSLLPSQRGSAQGARTAWQDARPRWYRRALGTHPEVVAKAFVAVNLARVRAKTSPDSHLHDMATKQEYEAVARLAVRRMVAAFPSRCTRVQVQSLKLVLMAGLNHAPRAELKGLVLQRLTRKGMDLMQRAVWLAVGLCVDSHTWVQEAVEFLADGQEIRCWHVVRFLGQCGSLLGARHWVADWTSADLTALIKAVGSRLQSPRNASLPVGVVAYVKPTPPIAGWIEALGERTDDAARAALTDLLADLALESWRGKLLRARDEQAKRLRMAAFTAPTLREMRKALRGGPPTGPADFTAVVSEQLDNAAERIRHGSADAWRLFWHLDPKDRHGRRVTGPKPENGCRDALLTLLEPSLENYDVILQPEVHHAESKRSDMLAIHGTYAVPVELKRSHSSDLWTAISNQLVPRYTRDPRSGGYGIYAVLWFGPGYQKASPSGIKPESAAELKSELEKSLTSEHQRTIEVVVIDVSEPVTR